MGQIIDGKAVSAKVKEEIRLETEKLKEQGIEIGLAVVIVGDDPASQVYVRNKEKACETVGFNSFKYALPAETTEEELDKDVDAFHPVNVGKIMIGDYSFLPCTPAGVMELIKSTGTDIAGKECVVVGRSNIVGKPQAMLLLHNNGTVTICHSKTKDLKEVCQRADILVAAVGRPKMITADYIKEGAVVIDVGMDRDENGKLCGDVDFEDCKDKASFITPVPGGVGPMTIAMLMQNTLTAAKRQNNA